jgi:hypothetical protein
MTQSGHEQQFALVPRKHISFFDLIYTSTISNLTSALPVADPCRQDYGY